MKLLPNIEVLTETVGPRNVLDDTMLVPLIVQRLLGYHILNPIWSWKRFILYQIASCSMIIYICIGTTEILSNTTDIKDIAEACYTFAIIGIAIVKYLLFVDNRIMFRKAYIKGKTCILDTISDDSKVLMKVLKQTKLLTQIMFAAILVPISLYILKVIWFYLQGEKVLLSKTSSTLLPMKTPYYEVATIMHAIFMCGIASTYTVIDLWFLLMMDLYSAASDCIAKILIVKKEDGEEDKSYSLRLNEHLRKFYLRHVKLVEYLQILNKTFKWQTLIPLLTVIILSCIPMLSMSKELDLTFGSNIMPTILEVFTFNWYGEQIKTKSESLREALIYFDWVNLERKDRKSYYVIMSFMNKEFAVKSAVGSELSLITMTSVLKASYQVFTMLQSFEN